MNQLLKTIDITEYESLESIISKVDANIYIVGINSDLFFTAKENRDTYNEIRKLKIMYSIARLIHNTGTMPLIEYEQLDNLLEVVFKKSR
jgi:homoserine acetyltransferase